MKIVQMNKKQFKTSNEEKNSSNKKSKNIQIV